MGYIIHHTIVVTSWETDKLKRVHKKAKEIFKECFSKEIGTKDSIGLKLISRIQGSITNKYSSFFIAPDGSKEGWDTSEFGDLARKKLIKYINHLAYEEGSNSIAYAELYFGEDNGKAEIINHN